jgi:hypothetical protein
LTTSTQKLAQAKALRARIAIIGLSCLVSWPSAAQPSQKLFESNDHLPRAVERQMLDSEESGFVTRMRGQSKFVKDTKVLKKLNLDALYGKAITIITPDGEEVTYSGEMTGSSDPSVRSWFGVVRFDGHLSIVVAPEGVDVNAAYKGRSYVIRTLPKGRMFMFAELNHLEFHESEPKSNFVEPSASQPRSK